MTAVALREREVAAALTAIMDAAGTPLLARITRLSRDQLGLVEGMDVVAQIKSVALLG